MANIDGLDAERILDFELIPLFCWLAAWLHVIWMQVSHGI